MTKKTVFVVGAGASYEFGLPVGTGLQAQIRRLTRMNSQGSRLQANSGNGHFVDALPYCAGLAGWTVSDHQRLIRKSHLISTGVQLAASIDNYLHNHQDDQELIAIGKLAIAYCIIEAEAESSIAHSSNNEVFKSQGVADAIEPHNTWMGLLVKTLTAGRDFGSFCAALSSITFICFNYDRCIERYLFATVPLIYSTDNSDLDLLSNSLNIIHPYGFLGQLRIDEGNFGTFGKIKDSRFLIAASHNIRTFTEGMESSVKVQITQAIAQAKMAVFLGYGFITTNDKFLFDDGPFELDRVLGTTFGVSVERVEHISFKLKEKCLNWRTPHEGLIQRGVPELRSEGCSDLIQRFSHIFENIGVE